MAVISHWGAELDANPEWLIEEPALTILGDQLKDAFEQIERWDLVVDRASIYVNTADAPSPRLVIRVTPRISPTDVLPDKAPREVVCHAPCCPECYMPKSPRHIHPDNGCPYGVVEQVMLT